jgi:hypothetical protein
MKRTRVRMSAGLITFGIFTLVVLGWKPLNQPTAAEDPAKEVGAGRAVSMPAQLTGLLISLGLKDQKATDWDGAVSVSAGKILDVSIVEGHPKAAAKGSEFSVRSVLAVKKKEKKKAGGIIKPIVRVTLDAPATARVKVTTKQGKFEFTLGDLPAASPQTFLEGQVSVQREEGALRLTTADVEHDYPVLAKAPDGTLWLAYTEYRTGRPYVAERVLAGNFDDLVPQGNGDQVRLKHFDGKTWSPALDVTEPGLDIWRPTVTVAGGLVHVSWSQQVKGNWDIYHRVYRPPTRQEEQGRWSQIVRVSQQPGTDYQVVSTTAANGRVWLAWQGWRQGRFQILARALESRERDDNIPWLPEVSLTDAKANHWSPAIAADATGKVYVAYDTYANDNYDVRVAEITATGTRTHDIVRSARFEARPSLLCDDRNRLWIAYEEGDEQWGKDYSTNMFRKIGFEENPGNALYITRTVRVKCLAGGKLMQPTGDLQKAIAETTANNRSVPRLGMDGAGSMWLLYRHHPKPLGAGEVWNSFAVRHDGKDWDAPRRLAQSDNLMDNRPALAPLGQGLIAVYSGDGRTKQQDRKRNDLFATLLVGSGPTQPAVLLADSPAPKEEMKPVHPNETADVARIRAHRLQHQGKQLRLMRGEFHRHTEYTAHRDQDGLLEDSWRYALDAGALDWMGNADHDNGHFDEYSWWQIQKMTDVMHHPPTFVAVHSYERSVKYPNGHRNVIFPKRGIRPLPRADLEGTEEGGTPDTKLLYRYLKHFGGMCSSHTSGTGMGTDWRDNDPVVEPVVEVYQGHRHNYEHFGAPRSATEKTNIGGYEPKGFVWHAFAKGYKLGFQASSDHVSTHMSYGMVLTDDISRQGIIDAFKRRHSYAATDNIILDVRCGNYLMGDIFDVAGAPTFTIKILGTAPVTKVSIIRDAQYIHVEEPNRQNVTFSYTDREPALGKTSYYYVRVEQRDANLAWGSPMWITVKGK